MHGLRGEVVLKTFDPTSTAINEVDVLVLVTRDGKEHTLELASVGEAPGGDLLIRFEGMTRREHAEPFKASGVFVRREDLEPPMEGEVFLGDLVGLEAVTAEGKRLGEVAEIWSSGPVPNLVIREGSEELMIPFAEEFVTKVDVPGKRITVIPLSFDE
ncbi:MAG: 16S rRNA processing protein RimM [Archangium gephyra]|uniref:Ribosome maturation factor RimM n=1 Tax=Archangium gephyra TaxID=48 RepID=A0A2W5TK84_9BACT|nr:MAG: 16S rRNA processing protein RimM [Archangium gephyra]